MDISPMVWRVVLMFVALVAAFALGVVVGRAAAPRRAPRRAPLPARDVPPAVPQRAPLMLPPGRRVLAIFRDSAGRVVQERTFARELPRVYRRFHGRGPSLTFELDLPSDTEIPDVVTFRQVV